MMASATIDQRRMNFAFVILSSSPRAMTIMTPPAVNDMKASVPLMPRINLMPCVSISCQLPFGRFRTRSILLVWF